MASNDGTYEDERGSFIWRTVGGRKIKIYNGQSLSEAMIQSGKFKNLRSDYRKAKQEEQKEEEKKDEEPEKKKLMGYRINEETGKKELYEHTEEDNELGHWEKDANGNRVFVKNPRYKEENSREQEIKLKQDISSNEAIDEMMNADTGDWNNMNQAERDKTCEKILNDFEDKYGDKLKDKKFREEVLDGLEDQNFHTMGKIIEQKYEYSDNQELSDLDNRIAQATREQEIKAKQEAVNKSFEENQRLEIAKDIAKEVYGLNENNATPERIEREARKILEPVDGEVLEKGDEPFTNSKGQLERSTKSLEQWRDSLKNNEKNDTFTSQSTNPFYPDREYSKEDLKKMEKNGVKPMDNTYSGSGWKGVNADKNLSTKEQAKAITDEMKKQYPDVKISRKSDIYSGGSSIDFNIMSSEKDLYVSDADIDKLGSEQLFNTDITRGYGFDRWAENNVPNYKTEHSYSVDDVKKYAKESLSELKKRDNQNVRGNEWYLSDYGKKVVTELNKQANSYTYDDSDAMTDYFNHGTYMHISIGKYNKPYEVTQKTMNDKVRDKFYTKKDGTKVYDPYKGTPYELKYDSVEDAIKDPNSKMNNYIRQKAFEKYKKEHPNTKKTLQDFMNKK